MIVCKCDICNYTITDFSKSTEITLFAIVDPSHKGAVEERKQTIEHICLFCQIQIANYI